MVDYSALIEMAFEAREKSVCDFSGFAVGAALLCESGEVFTGCNIECCAYSATICAERTAIFKAISEGETEFVALVVVGGRKDEDVQEFCTPCGLCRQVIAEFCSSPDFEVILAKNTEEYVVYKVEQLLPEAFSRSML